MFNATDNKSNNIQPLISVVLPTHNRADRLPFAVESIINQTYKNIEIIIIDDTSSDNTPEVIDQLVKEHDSIVAIRAKSNLGAGGAYNMGIDRARGDYIAIMDDDDIANPQRLERQLNTFFTEPEIELAYSSIEWMDENFHVFHASPGYLIRGDIPDSSIELFKLLYLYGLGIPNQTIMAKRKLWDRFKYPTSPRAGFDWILLLQITASNVKFRAITEPLVKVYKGKGKESVTAGSRKLIYPDYLESFKIINEWLEKKGMHELLKLKPLAKSNLYLRESRHYLGLKGISFIVKGMFAAPTNLEVWKEVISYPKKVIKNFKPRYN